VDSRGTGASPGVLDPLSGQQAHDFYDAIEWAGTQPWCSGKVGLLGISYYAMSQWAVAALKPPHLAAMIAWEGAADMYRDFLRHAGILNADFVRMWAASNARVQHSGTDGNLVGDDERARLRVDTYAKAKAHALDDDAYRAWLRDVAEIEVPFVSVGNWGNLLLHLRGNTEAFARAASREKWLRIVVGDHFVPFYAPEALALQQAFFGHYLKGEDTGWTRQPRVRVAVRQADGIRWRDDGAWPLSGTRWTDLHLDASALTLQPGPNVQAGSVDLRAPGGSVSFTYTASETIEITGPVALRLWASATSPDLDLYLTLRQVRADGTQQQAIDPSGQPTTALAQGWLRASHRTLDAERSLPYRPYLSHEKELLLRPGEVAPLDIEIWPTSLVLDPGDRLVLDVSSSDNPAFGFRMDTDPDDRPADRFDGTYTLHTGPEHSSWLRVPVITDE
jgi:predicted acyl esterase